ncbi:MAG: DNA-directed RNA polymerase subunit beta [Candidatus Peregrinibacteria bacterium GW2011_GWA2_54_9]|nr:MAG: DNA-directed RNA polymerase subunit beta [Candidatus Peregrinibacteria bacterium GW2011_GWA2_54_9]
MATKKKPAARKRTKKAVSKKPAKKIAAPASAKASAGKRKPQPKKHFTPKTAPKRTVAKKKSFLLQKKVKKGPVAKRAYQMRVEEEVMPQVRPHVVPAADRIPSACKKLPNNLRPVKVEDNRLFFVEDSHTDLPSLIEMQLQSYRWFLTEGLKELLEEISPITDFSGKKMELRILGHTFDPPKYDPDTCRRRNLSFEAVMKGHVQLINKETGEIKEQDVFLGSIPLMTEGGTFIVGGIERVVVHQLVRSPGAFFSKMPDVTKYHTAKIIPKRGVWLEIETDRKGILACKIDRKRKIPVTQLLRVFGYETDQKILDLFRDITREKDFILATLEKDAARTVEDAYQSIYRRIRPGDLATPENAKQLIDGLFFDFKKYDMGSIARYKLNRRFGLNLPSDELVQNKYRVGLVRTERIVKDRMTVMDQETVTPMQLINCRPITAAMREFFASSQLSQFMDQTNPLSELAHKRRLSAMGPGGLSRERASFDVRDVHPSHFGRICPIATPEGPNIGLVVHLAGYARVNEYGFLETPYREVKFSSEERRGKRDPRPRIPYGQDGICRCRAGTAPYDCTGTERSHRDA